MKFLTRILVAVAMLMVAIAFILASAPQALAAPIGVPPVLRTGTPCADRLYDVSAAISFAQGQAPGTTAATISQAKDGENIAWSIAPDDGSFKIVGDYFTGRKVVFGTTTHAVGVRAYTLTAKACNRSRSSTLTNTTTAGSSTPVWIHADSTNYSGVPLNELDATLNKSWNAIDSVEGTISAFLDCSRNPDGYAVTNAGTLKYFAAGTCRQTDRGLFVEGTGFTNLLTAPFTPATQTVSLTAGQTYTLSMSGFSGANVTITGPPFNVQIAAVATSTFTGALANSNELTVTGTIAGQRLAVGCFVSGNGITNGTAYITDVSQYSYNTGQGKVILSQTVSTASAASMTSSQCRATSAQAWVNKPVTFTAVTTGTYTVTVNGGVAAMQLETGTQAHMPYSGTRAADDIRFTGRLLTAMQDVTGGETFEFQIEGWGPAGISGVQPFLVGGCNQTNINGCVTGVGSNGIRLNTNLSLIVNDLSSATATLRVFSWWPTEQPFRLAVSSDSASKCAALQSSQTSSTSACLTGARSKWDRLGTAECCATQGGNFILKRMLFAAKKFTTSDGFFVGTDDPSDTPTGIANYIRHQVSSTFRYASSIDSVWQGATSNWQAARIGYDPRAGARPLIVWLHGTGGKYADFRHPEEERWVARGFTSLTCGMRGNASNGGTAQYVNGPTPGWTDSGMREIIDVKDCVAQAEATYGQFIDTGQEYVMGYSGGGGDVVQLATKTDIFNAYASAWPPADYGDHWDFGGSINIGNNSVDGTVRGGRNAADDPTIAGNIPKYRARNTTESFAINARFMSHLYLTGDIKDPQVRYVSPHNVWQNAGYAGYSAKVTYWETNMGDANVTRSFLHGDPTGTSTAVWFEDLWKNDFLSGRYSRYAFPKKARGVWVGGLWYSRRGIFVQVGAVLSGNAIAGSNGATAVMSYDYDRCAFTLTPIQPTTGVPYSITCKGVTSTGTLNGPTSITVH